jgi:hypothetical protein
MYSIAHFNNANNQTTTLIVHNDGRDTVNGHIHFWDDSGNLLASFLLGPQPTPSLAPKQTYTLDTSSLPGLAGTSGSITISNDGRYGVLSGKAVELDVEGGVAIETPLEPRK